MMNRGLALFQCRHAALQVNNELPELLDLIRLRLRLSAESEEQQYREDRETPEGVVRHKLPYTVNRRSRQGSVRNL
jgi:hypothetical protein